VDQIPSAKGHLILSAYPGRNYHPRGEVSPPAAGGQDAVVGTFSSSGDAELVGSYFLEITGVSGGGSLRLAIDGNVTAIPDPVTSTSAPELSTWAMLLLGFAGLGFAGYRASRRTAGAAA
jgi:hypothetical protein